MSYLAVSDVQACRELERAAEKVFRVLPGGRPWFRLPPERLSTEQQITIFGAAKELAHSYGMISENEFTVEEVSLFLGLLSETAHDALENLRERRIASPLDDQHQTWRIVLSGAYWSLRLILDQEDWLEGVSWVDFSETEDPSPADLTQST